MPYYKKKSSSKRSVPHLTVRVVVQKPSGKPNYRRKKRTR